MKKIKINSVSNLQMQIQVQELHLQAFNWLKKHLHKLYTAKPLTRHDAMCPMSVESDPIGKRKVRKHVAINPEMTRVIAPFKKVVTHMN